MEEKVPFVTDTSVVSKELVDAATVGFASAQWQVGDALYRAGNYGQAFYWINRAAHHGIVPAMNALGYMCLNGFGAPASEKRAFIWTAKAALKGDSSAAMNLGLMYFHGQGCLKNDNAALHWMRKASEANNADAIRCLAFFYMNGIGAKADKKSAFEIYRKAARGGDVASLKKMGDCYARGAGVNKDYLTALDLYRQAGDAGNADANLALGLIFMKGNEAIAKDISKAHYYLDKASIAGSIKARLYNGRLYIEERRDLLAAYYWLYLAARAGDRDAKVELKRFGSVYTWPLADEHMRTVFNYSLGAPK